MSSVSQHLQPSYTKTAVPYSVQEMEDILNWVSANSRFLSQMRTMSQYMPSPISTPTPSEATTIFESLTTKVTQTVCATIVETTSTFIGATATVKNPPRTAESLWKVPTSHEGKTGLAAHRVRACVILIFLACICLFLSYVYEMGKRERSIEIRRRAIDRLKFYTNVEFIPTKDVDKDLVRLLSIYGTLWDRGYHKGLRKKGSEIRSAATRALKSKCESEKFEFGDSVDKNMESLFIEVWEKGFYAGCESMWQSDKDSGSVQETNGSENRGESGGDMDQESQAESILTWEWEQGARWKGDQIRDRAISILQADAQRIGEELDFVPILDDWNEFQGVDESLTMLKESGFREGSKAKWIEIKSSACLALKDFSIAAGQELDPKRTESTDTDAAKLFKHLWNEGYAKGARDKSAELRLNAARRRDHTDPKGGELEFKLGENEDEDLDRLFQKEWKQAYEVGYSDGSRFGTESRHYPRRSKESGDHSNWASDTPQSCLNVERGGERS